MSRFTRLRNSVLKSVKGVQAGSVSITATSDGTGLGAIPQGTRFATISSSNANYIVTLPTPVVGTVIYLMNGATGYELRTSAPASISINGGADTNAESAIAANTLVRMVCVSATTWLGNTVGTDGTAGVVEAAAA